MLLKRKYASYRKLDDALSNSLDAYRMRRSEQMILHLCAKTPAKRTAVHLHSSGFMVPGTGFLGKGLQDR